MEIIEKKVCVKPHRNLEFFIDSIVKKVAELNIEVEHSAIDEWPRYLEVCVHRGGYFE